MNHFLLAFLLFCSVTSNSYAQVQTAICESTLPKKWQALNGKLSLTGQHFKLGKQAVKWDWTAGQKSQLLIRDKAFQEIVNNPRRDRKSVV